MFLSSGWEIDIEDSVALGICSSSTAVTLGHFFNGFLFVYYVMEGYEQYRALYRTRLLMLIHLLYLYLRNLVSLLVYNLGVK